MKNLSLLFDVQEIELDYSDVSFDEERHIDRIEAIRRNSEIVTCPKCGVTGNRPNMMRWHFDNCKTELKRCAYCGNTIPRQNIKDYLYSKKEYCNRTCYTESKKGKAFHTPSESERKKISKRNSKKLSVDGKVFNSRTEMSKVYKLSGQKFKEWLDSGKIKYL